MCVCGSCTFFEKCLLAFELYFLTTHTLVLIWNINTLYVMKVCVMFGKLSLWELYETSVLLFGQIIYEYNVHWVVGSE